MKSGVLVKCSIKPGNMFTDDRMKMIRSYQSIESEAERYVSSASPDWLIGSVTHFADARIVKAVEKTFCTGIARS